jgi:hypothetical protein
MPPARKREPIVPQKVRDAVEHMFTTPGATLQGTAQHIGWTTRKLRFYLGQPHCIRWMLTEKQARLEAASAGNIGALLSVRDHGDNAMAKVHAAKTIEQMLDVTSERTGIDRQVQQQRVPGLQIVILPAIDPSNAIGESTPLIEGTATPDVEPAPSDLDNGRQEARRVRFAPADPRGRPGRG